MPLGEALRASAVRRPDTIALQVEDRSWTYAEFDVATDRFAARLDEDGYYWFVGRTKEIIVRAGSNISPQLRTATTATAPAWPDGAAPAATCHPRPGSSCSRAPA
jgi:long-chain acyl-CoA synthetase